jgi:hypothetical protein
MDQLTPPCNEIVSAIRARIVDLVDSVTLCPELRRIGRVLAEEFEECKSRQGLEASPEEIDIDSSARAVLKRQLLCLYEGRTDFTPIERVYLQHLTDMVAKL